MKKIFTCLTALVLSMGIGWAQNVLLADEQESSFSHVRRAPAAVETVETSTTCVAMADYRSSMNLYQLQIYVNSPENLCFCVAATVTKSTQWVTTSFTTTYSSIYTYNGLPASNTINGTKRCAASAISGSIKQVYGNYYYADVYLTGANSPYNKQYHIKAYFTIPGNTAFSHDSESDALKLALQMSQAATKLTSGNTKYQATYETTINGTKYSYTAIAMFPGMNKAYIPSGKYPIKNSGTNGTYIKASTANNDYSNSIVELIAGGYYFYWHVMSGEAIAINPNQTSSPMFFQMKFNNTYWGFASYTQLIVQGTAPTKRSLTVSAGAGASGSASITCAEGHGYANSATADFTANGDYYYEGTTVSLVAPAAATGYHFQNWTKNSSQVSTNSTYELGNVSSTNSGAYVANYAANTYSVRFNKNNGTGTMSDEEFTYGDAAKALTANVFQRTGYNFKGWATSVSRADAGTVDYTDQQAVQNLTTENEKVINLYAVWELITYNLTYTGLEGATHSNPATYTIVSETITLSAPSERTGYDFTSWTCGGETITEIAKGSTGDKEIVANWAQKTFAVTVESNNSTYGTVNQSSVANVPYGTEITTSNNTVTINGTTVTATPATATAQYTYALDSWTNGTTTVTAATTVTANFSLTLNQYTVTINDPEHGTLTVKNGETPITSSTKVDYGTTLTVTYQADGGYHFDAWTNDGEASVTIDGDKTIGATFAPNVHTLTWAGIDGATLSGYYTAAGDVAYGTTLVAPTVEKAGFNFLGWSPAFVESTTMPDNDVTYTAQWEEASPYFLLYNDKNSGDPYYTTYTNVVGETKDVQFVRTFKADSKACFSLPFDYNFINPAHTTFKGLVYEITEATYDGNGYLVLKFMPNTTGIEANHPYLLYNNTGADIVNPIFEGVILQTIEAFADEAITVESPDNNTLTFHNTTCRQQLTANDKSCIVINNNLPYYPGDNTFLRAFSGYFTMTGTIYHAPMRIQLGDEETDLPAMDAENANKVKKYMQHGILIIERNGVRFNAMGNKLN